jgi:hypothetical protein
MVSSQDRVTPRESPGVEAADNVALPLPISCDLRFLRSLGDVQHKPECLRRRNHLDAQGTRPFLLMREEIDEH